MLKPLKQSDYNSILVKDLGMQYPTPESNVKKRYAIFICHHCKEEYRVRVTSIKNNITKMCQSCGVDVWKRSSVTHRESLTRLYRIWGNMKSRCYNSKVDSYSRYGGRGIGVCEEWVNSFISFRDWALLNGYSDSLTLDRINNELGYSMENCRWTTLTVQARNTRILRSTNTSGYRGVYKSSRGKKYEAAIRFNGKNNHLGTFDYAHTAAYAYDSFIIINGSEHTRNF